MNKKIKFIFIIIILALAAGAVFIMLKSKGKINSDEITTEVSPVFGSIQNIISSTGTVLPKNRLEIKPPVAGRVENILVREGEAVKAGGILAWMSSTERAALLDAARGQGKEKLKYWEEAYKPIALLAPINAEVIVAKTQAGQTVTTNDAVVVLSDQLIVRAQVDETDIGKIKLGQKATVILDAYPDTKINSGVGHIYYESKTANNVTIYEVDLVLEETPQHLRSGMNATVNFIENSKENTLLIPLEAVHRDKESSFVLLKKNSDQEPLRQAVKLGISDDKNAEIIWGITANDRIIIKAKKYSLPKTNTGTNPFLPFRRREPARK